MAHNKITDNMCLRWRRRAGRRASKQASMQLEARKGQQRECRPIREATRPADYHNVCMNGAFPRGTCGERCLDWVSQAGYYRLDGRCLENRLDTNVQPKQKLRSPADWYCWYLFCICILYVFTLLEHRHLKARSSFKKSTILRRGVTLLNKPNLGKRPMRIFSWNVQQESLS